MAKSKPATKSSAPKATKSSSAKKSTKKAPAKKAPASKAKPDETEAKIDRRRKARRSEEEAAAETSPAPKLERRKKVNRRRQIDPTTCERDYSDAEVEFMNALDDYKRKSGRMFPTCSEVLEVIRGLGYVQLSAAEFAARAGDSANLSADEQEQQAVQEALDAQAESEGLQVDAAEEAALA